VLVLGRFGKHIQSLKITYQGQGWFKSGVKRLVWYVSEKGIIEVLVKSRPPSGGFFMPKLNISIKKDMCFAANMPPLSCETALL
jgi:hypothetical protein